jgi:hypothetical protein
MKKLSFLIIAIAIVGFSNVSCTKNHTCGCHYDEDHGDHTHHEHEDFEIKDQKKSDAESTCTNYGNGLKENPEIKNVKCELE